MILVMGLDFGELSWEARVYPICYCLSIKIKKTSSLIFFKSQTIFSTGHLCFFLDLTSQLSYVKATPTWINFKLRLVKESN
jgi:hypothetical protein